MEEGDISPIQGNLEDSFPEIDSERKKQLRNKILLWGGVSLGVLVIIIVIIIIILSVNSGNDKEDTKEIYGEILCTYEVSTGEINILSEEFDYKNNLIIYLNNNEIPFSKKHSFDITDAKTIKYAITSESFSMEKMFRGVEHLKGIIFQSEKGGKITSMESTFENCIKFENFNFNKGFDTSQLTSMKKAFTNCQSLKDIQFYNMTLSNVKDMSFMFYGVTNLETFAPNNFDISSVETMSSMFSRSGLKTIILPKMDSMKLNKQSNRYDLNVRTCFLNVIFTYRRLQHEQCYINGKYVQRLFRFIHLKSFSFYYR